MAKTSPQNIYSNSVNFLTVYPKFLYEVSLYKIWKDRAECIDSQFYMSDAPLTISKEVTSRKVEDYTLVKFISWLSAPLDYLLNNNYKLITNETTRRGRKSNSRKN